MKNDLPLHFVLRDKELLSSVFKAIFHSHKAYTTYIFLGKNASHARPKENPLHPTNMCKNDKKKKKTRYVLYIKERLDPTIYHWSVVLKCLVSL